MKIKKVNVKKRKDPADVPLGRRCGRLIVSVALKGIIQILLRILEEWIRGL